MYETNDYRQNSYQVPAENSQEIYDRRILFSSIATNLIQHKKAQPRDFRQGSDVKKEKCL